ncbi:hypothetical protein RND81_03G113800 [Saponaria officinalis]|uniref:Uncharacterized protein n=1 Tax=Saponaria officinalis TaxID=3572 RepID=A0AAW1LZM6_SAPOF
MKAVDEILDKIRRDSRIYYLRHQHEHGRGRDACSVDRNVNGPFTTNFIPQNSVVAAIGSFVYCFLRDAPTCFACDFSQPLPKWDYEESFTSSFYVVPFETLTLDEKLYIFGCNGSSEKLSGKIFDPTKKCWDDLTLPIDIEKSNRLSLILASAGQKVLVWYEYGLHQQLHPYEYDPQYLRWNLFDPKGLAISVRSSENR